MILPYKIRYGKFSKTGVVFKIAAQDLTIAHNFAIIRNNTFMKKLFDRLKSSLEELDARRDKILFVFIKPYWPRKITPNHLTIFRIFIGIFLAILLFYYHSSNEQLIIFLFIIGIISDLLDGSIARGLNKVTKFGTITDPIADRILIIPIVIDSLIRSHLWLLATLIGLEIFNAFISMYAYKKHIHVNPNIYAKTKMVLQSVVLAAILIFWPKPPYATFVYILWFSLVFMIVGIFFKIGESFRKIPVRYWARSAQ